MADPEDIRIGNVDYVGLLAGSEPSNREPFVLWLWEELVYAFRDAYLAMTPRTTDIVRIQQGAFEYVYDDYSSLEAQGRVPYHSTMEARLVAAIGRSAPAKPKRDDTRLRGWSGRTLGPAYGPGWDRGHFIAHSIGGVVDGFELNVFVQRRALNRGWKAHVGGTLYRRMESFCAEHTGTFCFSPPDLWRRDVKANVHRMSPPVQKSP
jgi:hypothetical protein